MEDSTFSPSTITVCPALAPSLVTGHHVHGVGHRVDDPALPLVSPLGRRLSPLDLSGSFLPAAHTFSRQVIRARSRILHPRGSFRNFGRKSRVTAWRQATALRSCPGEGFSELLPEETLFVVMVQEKRFEAAGSPSPSRHCRPPISGGPTVDEEEPLGLQPSMTPPMARWSSVALEPWWLLRPAAPGSDQRAFLTAALTAPGSIPALTKALGSPG